MKVSALHQNVLLFVVNTVPEQMDYMAVTSCFVFRRFWEFSLNPCVYHFIVNMVVVQSLSCVWLFGIPWTAAHQASLSFTISSLLKFMFIESVMLSNHLIFYCPLLLLLSFFPSIRVFSSESALCIRWPKYWSFSISSSSEYSGLIFFRIDWFDLLVVQGILKGLLQHPNLKSSIYSK